MITNYTYYVQTCHREEDGAILVARGEAYIAAKARHPRSIKCLNPVEGVWLNPDKVVQKDDGTEEKVA